VKNFDKSKKQNKNLNPITSKSSNYQRSDINILLNKVKLDEKLEKRKKIYKFVFGTFLISGFTFIFLN
tara:strand:- start:35 stop:238 length:204 start_codon:yes stop_codon:yes gene_type:complete